MLPNEFAVVAIMGGTGTHVVPVPRPLYKHFDTCSVPWSQDGAVEGKLAALHMPTATPPVPHVWSPDAHTQAGTPAEPGASAENMQHVPSPAPEVVVPFG
jgi:hypothetical protein